MKTMFILPFALCLIFSSYRLDSQETDTTSITKPGNNPAINFLIKEKMKISPEDALKFLRGEKINIKKFNNDKKDILQSKSEVLVSDDAVPESEIHAAINPKDSNNILISPIRMNSDFTSFDDMLLCPVYYTKDFGKTWQKSDFKNKANMNNVLPLGGGDPVLIFDKNGTAYLTWIFLLMKFSGDSLFNTMHWAYSNDGGVNWNRQNDEFVAYTAAGRNSGLVEFYDKQWMAADYSNSQYAGNIYLSLTYIYQSQDYNIMVYRKEKGQNVFNKVPAKVSNGNYIITQFSNLDVDSKGNVHVIFWGTKDRLTNALYHAVSTNGGVSFQPETKISNFLLSGATMIPGDNTETFIGLNPDRLYPCPQMAVDKSGKSTDGNIYVTWTAVGINDNKGDALDVYLSKSTDGGVSWSEPKIVHDNTPGTSNCQYYSNIAVNSEGVLILGWYDRREDSFDMQTNYYMTYSFDGGETFIKNFKVTAQPTDFSTTGFMNNDFGIGEYNMLLSTKGYAIPVWSDGRTNDGDMNVYSAFVKITDEPSPVERITTVNGDLFLNDPIPNPAANDFSISFNSIRPGLIKLYLTDIKGEIKDVIFEEKIDRGEQTRVVNTAGLASGEYYIVLKSETSYAMKKLIINK